MASQLPTGIAALLGFLAGPKPICCKWKNNKIKRPKRKAGRNKPKHQKPSQRAAENFEINQTKNLDS